MWLTVKGRSKFMPRVTLKAESKRRGCLSRETLEPECKRPHLGDLCVDRPGIPLGRLADYSASQGRPRARGREGV